MGVLRAFDIASLSWQTATLYFDGIVTWLCLQPGPESWEQGPLPVSPAMAWHREVPGTSTVHGAELVCPLWGVQEPVVLS